MYPVLFNLESDSGQLVLRSYDVLLALAWLTVCFVGGWLALQRGIPRRKLLVFLGGLTLAGLVGARLGHGLLNLDVYHDAPERLLQFSSGSFSMWGVVLFGSLAGWCICRWMQLDAWLLADALAPGLCAGYALAKTGCFLNGCCGGRPTSLPWGVFFPIGTSTGFHQATTSLFGLLAPTSSVHPSQLYEVLVGITALAVVIMALRRQVPCGVPALLAGILFVLGRAIIGSTRISSLQTVLPAWQAVLCYSVLLLILTSAMHRRWLHGPAESTLH